MSFLAYSAKWQKEGKMKWASRIFAALGAIGLITAIVLGQYLFDHRPELPSISNGYILKIEESNHGNPHVAYVTRLEFGLYGLGKGFILVFIPLALLFGWLDRMSTNKH